MSRWVGALAAALLTLPAAAQAAALDEFLDGVRTLSARFVQTQYDESGDVLSESSGTLQLSRPDRFNWTYEQPYRQLVVCDGQRIWIYDPDLEQVTRRDVRTALSGTPAALLSRDRSALDAFHLEPGDSADGLSVVRLVPKADDGDFAWIRVEFDGRVPVTLEFADRLGGRTLIRLHEVQVNRPIADRVFRFTPPPGVEVVDG